MSPPSSIQMKPFSSSQFRGNPTAVDPYTSDSTTGAPISTPGPGDGNHMTYITTQTIMKTRSKTKAAAVPVSPFYLKKTKNDTTNIKDNRKKVLGGSAPVNLSEKHEAKEVVNLADNKKKKWSSKGGFKKYVMPSQDSFEQQNAYFKEIDEYELMVEEVE